MAVHSGCAIGDLMEDDLYNPFCVDGIDPLSLTTSTAGEFLCIHRKLQLLALRIESSLTLNSHEFLKTELFP